MSHEHHHPMKPSADTTMSKWLHSVMPSQASNFAGDALTPPPAKPVENPVAPAPASVPAPRSASLTSPAPKENERLAQCLQRLTDLPFAVGGDNYPAAFTGKVTLAQLDRLNYLKKQFALDLTVQHPGDAASEEITQVVVKPTPHLPTMEELAAREPERRRAMHEAADLLWRATGYPFVSDELCIATKLPEPTNPEYQKITAFLQELEQKQALPQGAKTVFPEAAEQSKENDAQAKAVSPQWLSLHDVNLHVLQQVCRENPMEQQTKLRQ